jgi:hypothetical protein
LRFYTRFCNSALQNEESELLFIETEIDIIVAPEHNLTREKFRFCPGFYSRPLHREMSAFTGIDTNAFLLQGAKLVAEEADLGQEVEQLRRTAESDKRKTAELERQQAAAGECTVERGCTVLNDMDF